MRVGLIASIGGHLAVLVWGVVSFPEARPFDVGPVDTLPVDLVPISEITRLRIGEKDAEVREIEATKPALILSITTPVSQNIKNQLGGKGIPVVFSAVTDPVAAGLVPSWESGDANMTGASDALDINATLAFARKLLPDAKVFGVPYNPGEANDAATLDLFKKASHLKASS